MLRIVKMIQARRFPDLLKIATYAVAFGFIFAAVGDLISQNLLPNHIANSREPIAAVVGVICGVIKGVFVA